MKFLVDHCAGRRLAEWLRAKGHDVFDAGEESDPGDRTLLERAAAEGRILVTLDRDFGRLVYVGGAVHAGLVRLPDVPVRDRLALMAEVLQGTWRSAGPAGARHRAWRANPGHRSAAVTARGPTLLVNFLSPIRGKRTGQVFLES